MRLDADIGRASVQRDQFSEGVGFALAPNLFSAFRPGAFAVVEGRTDLLS
jgi:hypothetical protein